MNMPTATYRIQFNPAFGFKNAQPVIAYLADLGISDLYASPIFKAVKGSTHGYDVVDPNQLNPELGGLSDLEGLAAELKTYNMGWIQDIVPNHMAIDSDNRLLMDILENGSSSRYFQFFDVDWDYPAASLNKRILAPFLGRFYGECLEDGEIALQYGPDGFKVAYFNLAFPLRIESYLNLFNNLSRLKKKLAEDDPDFIKLLGILYVLKSLSSSDEPEERNNQIKFIQHTMWEAYNSNAVIKAFVDENVRTFNGQKGKAESFNFLDDLLSQQVFRLSFWKVAAEEINYRRFFCVNGLISLRVEDEHVLNYTHGLIFDLIEKRVVTGVRIDHVDGLYDPGSYLQKVREKAPANYIIVEKILNLQEDLPPAWPVQGTTGYDFINYVNELFCQKENERAFSRIYSSVTGLRNSYADVVRDKLAWSGEVPIVVCDMGVDPHVFHPDGDARRQLGWDAEERVALFVGNLVEAKGVRHLLDAFARLRARDACDRLVIVGDGPQGSALSAAAAATGIGEAVRFVGSLPAPYLALHMAAADVLVLPSLSEGLGVVLLEAMACGTPCVASRVGGVPEVLDGTTCGRLVPPADAAALATALEEVLVRGRDAFSEACVAAAAGHSVERQAERFLGAVSAALEGGG